MANEKASGFVRYARNDTSAKVSHPTNMAGRKPKALSAGEYDKLREASGWYLRAWRHYRNLSLDDLADEVNTSKGLISDLESGKARWNRDNVDAYARALNTRTGFLLDTNPFSVDPDKLDLMDNYDALDQRDRQTLKEMAKQLRKR